VSVAALLLGQRVFVLRDEAGEAVGAWGTVARERWSRGHASTAPAWVRLDERHARCPFPPDLESRATWILTVPDSCSSFEPAPAPVTSNAPGGV
jgi:hypothetical protein